MSDERFGTIGEVDEKQLHLLVYGWRHGRADRNLLQAMQGAYMMVFILVLIGAMVINSVMQAQYSVTGCSAESRPTTRDLLPWAAVTGFLVMALVAARMLGPVVASAVESFWIMDGSVGRRRVLAGRLITSVIVALILGAGLGAFVMALIDSGAAKITTWGMASGLGCFRLVTFATAEQGAERRRVITALLQLIGVIAFAVLLVLVAISARVAPVDLVITLSIDFAQVVAGGGLLLGLVSVVPAWLRLRHMRRQQLTAGSSLLAGMRGTAFALDFAPVRDILVDDRARRWGHIRPTRGSSSGVWAIVLRDLQWLWRAFRSLVPWLVSMTVPYAAHTPGIEVLNLSISALMPTTASIGFCDTLRVLIHTKGLQRCFPFSLGEVRQAAMAVPTLLALLWAAAATPAFSGVFDGGELDLVAGFLTSLITALSGLLTALRWVCAKPPSYGGPMVPVRIGAMPPGVMLSFIRDIDVVVLITLPLVLGWPSWVLLVIATIIWLVLRSGFDQQALMDEHEKQQRLLAKQKSGHPGRGRGGQKVRVQRKR